MDIFRGEIVLKFCQGKGVGVIDTYFLRSAIKKECSKSNLIVNRNSNSHFFRANSKFVKSHDFNVS